MKLFFFSPITTLCVLTAKEEPNDIEDLHLFPEQDFGKDLDLGMNDIMTLLEEPGVQDCDKKAEPKLTNGVYAPGHQQDRLSVTNNTPPQPNHQQSLQQQPPSHISNTPSPQLQHNGLPTQQVGGISLSTSVGIVC